jgi:hypothetical protein
MPVISPPLHQKSKSERQRTSGFMAKEVLLYFKTMLAVSINYTMHQNLLLNPVTNEVKSIVQEAYKITHGCSVYIILRLYSLSGSGNCLHSRQAVVDAPGRLQSELFLNCRYSSIYPRMDSKFR